MWYVSGCFVRVDRLDASHGIVAKLRALRERDEKAMSQLTACQRQLLETSEDLQALRIKFDETLVCDVM